MSVKDVYVTKEIANFLDLSTQHLLRIVEEMEKKGLLTENDIRRPSKTFTVFSKEALKKIMVYRNIEIEPGKAIKLIEKKTKK